MVGFAGFVFDLGEQQPVGQVMDFIVISLLPIIRKSQITPPIISATGISQNPPTSKNRIP